VPIDAEHRLQRSGQRVTSRCVERKPFFANEKGGKKGKEETKKDTKEYLFFPCPARQGREGDLQRSYHFRRREERKMIVLEKFKEGPPIISIF